MKLPNNFTKAIADIFYDKEISVLEKQTSVDEEGGVTSKGYEEQSTFLGNARFNNLKEIQEEYGLDYQMDIAITTSNSTDVQIDNLIQYNEIIYKITDVLIFDSHKLIVANKWRQ